MKTINDINFKALRALIRVDFNVPLNEQFEVTDNNRIEATIPTILKILSDGGSVVLMSHLGRPKGGPEDKYSLRHIVDELESLVAVPILFADDCISDKAFAMSASLQPGQVLLLENLRFYAEEEKGDVDFAKKLARHGDVFVNDAFGTAHRAHASTAVIAQFFPDKKCFGYVMANEIENVSKVMHSGEKPVAAIVGGAKVSSKITIMKNLLPNVDHLIIGGGMAYTFIKALGGKVGNSLVEDDFLDLAREILEEAKKRNTQIHLPVDSLNADRFAADAETAITPAGSIAEGWMGLDIGPETIMAYSKVLESSKTILWNGPLGVFEMEKFANGTIEVGEAVARATEKGAFSLVGGGDSVAAAKQFGLDNRLSYVSTGGGAMLEYLEGKVLPGIDAVLN
jgi:phosphoglycerate kinase